MQTLLSCLTAQHDWRMLLLAAVVCLTSSATAFSWSERARRSVVRSRAPFAAASALTAGLGVWATHYVGMQAYDAPVSLSYEPVLTVASLLVVLFGQGLAIAVGLGGRNPLWRMGAAVVSFTSIAAMHFLGMAAMRLNGALSWDFGQAIGALAAGQALALLTAFAWDRLRRPWRAPVCGALASLSVVALHFTAMSAVTITPGAGLPNPAAALAESAILVGAFSAVAGVAVIAAFVWGMTYWTRTQALQQVREAIDAMPEGLGFYDADDRLVLWNARYAEVNQELNHHLEVGMRFRDILQIGIRDGIYDEAKGREKEWVEERLAARRQLSSTCEQFVAGSRWLRIKDQRTAAGGLVTVATDITDLKNQAQALEEARDASEAANRAKSQFLANMSHEIRTPLNGVIGVAQALAKTDLDPQQAEMLALIQSSSQTLQTLLSDILDLARVESGRMEIQDEPFDLGRAVREAAQLYEASAHAKGLRFEVEIAPGAEAWVRGDVVRLKQVLTNLVSNAVKFTGSGLIALRADVTSDRLRFSVEDTGIGFDEQTRERLFNRFEQADGGITRQYGGSGLGLSICRQLAEMMGGALDCESTPGGGSTFFLTLPLRTAEAPVAAEAADDQPLVGDIIPTLRVLIADDHPTNRKVVELILAQAAVELTSAENGQEALDAYRAGDFDLVLMDMQMPVMDGLTACREIRLHEAAHALPPCPLVMLTANALPEHVAAAQAAGADRHLAKPIDAAALLDLVAALACGAPRALAA